MPSPPTLDTPKSTPPSTALSTAKPISQEAFAAELSRGAPPKAESAPKEEASPKPVEKVAVVSADDGKPRSSLPSIGDAMQKSMADKAAKGAEAEAPPKTEAKAKDAAPVEKKVEPAKVAAETADPDADVPVEHRKVLPHDKPETAKRMSYFIRKASAAEAKAEAALKEAEAAKKQSPTAANVEEVTKLKEEHAKANEELIRYRRRFDIDNDAEFKAKYDEPLKAADTAIEETLKKYNLGDATMKVIKDAGGFAAFSRSTQQYPMVEKDASGEQVQVMRTGAEIARGWLTNGMHLDDAEFIRQSIGRQRMLAEEKKVATEKAVSEARQYHEQQSATQRKAQEEAAATNAKTTADHLAWLTKTEAETEWMKDRPVPDNATPEQTAEIEDHNRFQKQLRDGLRKNPTNVQEYGDLKLAAAESHHLRRTLGERDARIAELEAEVKKSKGALKTTGKGGSLLSGQNKPEPDKAPADPTNFLGGLRKSMAARGGTDD